MELIATLNETSAEKVGSLSEVNTKNKLRVERFVVDNDGNASVHTQNPTAITIEADLPQNARVKKVEIPDIVNGTDELFNLEDMVSKDASVTVDAPYFTMYPKGKQGLFCPYIAALAYFPYFTNGYYNLADSFIGKTIIVHYQIEE